LPPGATFRGAGRFAFVACVLVARAVRCLCSGANRSGGARMAAFVCRPTESPRLLSLSRSCARASACSLERSRPDCVRRSFGSRRLGFPAAPRLRAPELPLCLAKSSFLDDFPWLAASERQRCQFARQNRCFWAISCGSLPPSSSDANLLPKIVVSGRFPTARRLRASEMPNC